MKIHLLVNLLCSTPVANAYLRIKFQHWFPQYEQHWLGSVPHCEQRLQDYYTSNRSECSSPCACAADCFLSNVTGTIQSNFASAQVLLGLVPSVLMFVGPSIAEVATLSTHRPVLAVLVATASPAINFARLFSQVDVNEPLDRSTSHILTAWAEWIESQNDFTRTVVDTIMHVVALGALANNARNSVRLDLRTISGWRCSAILMPLGWSSAGIIVHSLGMLAIRTRVSVNSRPSVLSIFCSEIYQLTRSGKDTVLSEVLFGMASFFAIVHLIFGILELSSLVFISALEAVEVFGMYAISVLMCQCIVALEIARMRHSLCKTTIEKDQNLSTAPKIETTSTRAHTI